MALLAPIAVSLGLMLFFGGVAVFVMPGLIRAVMPRLPEQQQPYVLLGAVLSLAIGLVYRSATSSARRICSASSSLVSAFAPPNMFMWCGPSR